MMKQQQVQETKMFTTIVLIPLQPPIKMKIVVDDDDNKPIYDVIEHQGFDHLSTDDEILFFPKEKDNHHLNHLATYVIGQPVHGTVLIKRLDDLPDFENDSTNCSCITHIRLIELARNCLQMRRSFRSLTAVSSPPCR